MSFQTKIQALITSTSPDQTQTQSAVPWGDNENWQAGARGFNPQQLLQFNLTTGTLLNSAPVSNWSGAHGTYPVITDKNGVYLTAGSYEVIQINRGTLAEIQRINCSIPAPQGGLIPVTCTDSSNWLIAIGEGGPVTFGRVFGAIRTDVNPMTSWTPGVLSYNNFTACGCAGVAGSGIGYVFSGDLASGNVNTQLYKLNLNTGTQSSTLLATHVPTDYDAGWTNVSQNGIFLDQTDGNLVAVVNGTSVPKAYVVKFNASTGAIMWKLAEDSLYGTTGPNLYQSLIQAQQIVFITSISSVNTAVVVNTNAGTATTFTGGLEGLELFGGYAFNDQTGGLIGSWGFTEGADSPIPLNSTPSSFLGWGVLYLVPGKPPSPPAGKSRRFVAEVRPFSPEGIKFGGGGAG